MTDEEFLINPKADIQALQSTMNELEKLSGEEKAEEKAEEYAENILHCKLCTRCKGRRELTRRCEQFHFLYGGYLAGFAERKPQWHNLKKNPDDLPKNREEGYECQFLEKLIKENVELKELVKYEHNQFLKIQSKLDEQVTFNIQLGEEITELKNILRKHGWRKYD